MKAEWRGKEWSWLTKWWISSEPCFITRLPVWRSAGKSKPCGAAAQIYGSLIIPANMLHYSTLQYTRAHWVHHPRTALGCPSPGLICTSTQLKTSNFKESCLQCKKTTEKVTFNKIRTSGNQHILPSAFWEQCHWLLSAAHRGVYSIYMFPLNIQPYPGSTSSTFLSTDVLH